MSDIDVLILAAGPSPAAGLLRILLATARAAMPAPASVAAFLAGLDPAAYDTPLREGSRGS